MKQIMHSNINKSDILKKTNQHSKQSSDKIVLIMILNITTLTESTKQ